MEGNDVTELWQVLRHVIHRKNCMSPTVGLGKIVSFQLISRVKNLNDAVGRKEQDGSICSSGDERRISTIMTPSR